MKIEAILRKHARSATLLSSEPVKKGLLADLGAQKRFNSVVYAILFAAVCAVSLMAIAALFTDLVKAQANRTGILAGAGVGVPLALEWMRRVVREWSQLNLLITLVGHSDERSIQALIQKLLSSSATGLTSASDSVKGVSAS
jgi:hypothetical protein